MSVAAQPMDQWAFAAMDAYISLHLVCTSFTVILAGSAIWLIISFSHHITVSVKKHPVSPF